jgi:hypothetical protein
MPDRKDPAGKDEEARKKADEDLDEALKETFPASDPISPMRPGRDDLGHDD